MKTYSFDKKHNHWLHLILVAAEIAVIILFAFCTNLDEGSINTGENQATFDAQNDVVQHTLNTKYPMYMDIHAMIFVGFGFLMVFLKTNCWSGVGFNFLIACWAIQINILMQRFWEMALVDNRFVAIDLNMDTLIKADYGAAACLITFGAIMGKCTFTQIFILATMEMIFYSLNVTICKGIL